MGNLQRADSTKFTGAPVADIEVQVRGVSAGKTVLLVGAWGDGARSSGACRMGIRKM